MQWTRYSGDLARSSLSLGANADLHAAFARYAGEKAARLLKEQKDRMGAHAPSSVVTDLIIEGNAAEAEATREEGEARRGHAESSAMLGAALEAEAKAREAMAAVTAGLNKASASDAWDRMREAAARQDTPGALWQQTRDRVRTDKVAAAKQELAEAGREKERSAASGDPLADARAALGRVSPGDAVMKGRMDRLDAIAVSDREQDDLATSKAVWGLDAHETKRLALLKKDGPRRAKERARLLKALSRDLHAAAKALKRAIDHLRRSTDPKARAEVDRLEKLLGDVSKWAEDVDHQLGGTDAKRGGDAKDAPAPAPPTPAEREESAERRERGEDAVRHALGSSFLPAAAVVGGGRPVVGDVHVALPYGLVADRGHVALSQGYAPQSAVTPMAPPPIIGFLGTILDCPTSCRCKPPCPPGEACIRVPRTTGVMAPEGGETVTGAPATGAKGGGGTTRGGLTPAARGGGGGAGGDATFTQGSARRPLCPDGTIECITVPTPRPPAPPGRESGETAGSCRTRDGCRRPVLTLPSSAPSRDVRPSLRPGEEPCELSPEDEDALLLALGDLPASCAELARRARGAEVDAGPERAPGYLPVNEGVARRYEAARANRQTALSAFKANVAVLQAHANALPDLMAMLDAAREFDTRVREIWLRCPQFGLRARARIRELGDRMEALENCIRNAYRDIAVARALATEARRRWGEAHTVASALEGWVLRDRAYAEMGLLETALRGAADLVVGYSMLPLVASILGADLPTALPDSSARTAGGIIRLLAGVAGTAGGVTVRGGARSGSVRGASGVGERIPAGGQLPAPGAAAGQGISKAGGREVLYRIGTEPESASKLAEAAAGAEKAKIGLSKVSIHGVSASADPRAGASKALRDMIERHFRVHDTPTRANPFHRTIELPKPVTEDVASLFNRLFGRLQ